MNTERAHELVNIIAELKAQMVKVNEDSRKAFDDGDSEAIRSAFEDGRRIADQLNDARNELNGILYS